MATELIISKNALREKVEEAKLREWMILLRKLRSKAPRKISDEERAKIREKVFEEFENKFNQIEVSK